MSSFKHRIPAIGAALVLGSAALVGSVVNAPASQASPEAPKPRQVAERHAAELRLDYTAGRRTVSQRIERPGSTFVKVHVSGLKLGPGDRLTVADPAGKEKYTYRADPTKGPRPAGDSAYTIEGQGFWPMSITGDTAVVTLHTSGTRDAADLRAAGYGVQLDGYYRGFSQAEQASRDAMDPRAVCQTDARRDAVCYQSSHPTEYGKSRSVGKLLMGGGSCTAWRVGSTNRLLTNNHCMASQSEVAGSEVWFDYACATCGGNNPRTPTKVSGATFYRTNARLDYTVFSVNNFDSITSFGYLLLDNRAAVQGERIYISGHGDGDPNELSIFEDTQNGGTCKVDDTTLDNENLGYYCDTSGGSSGSPVLAASSNRVIALHHWGGCLNGGVRIDLIYPEIDDLIDNS